MRLYYLAICPAESLKIPFGDEKERDKWAYAHEHGPDDQKEHQVWIRNEDADTGLAYWGPPMAAEPDQPDSPAELQKIADQMDETDAPTDLISKPTDKDFISPHRAIPEEK